MTETENFLNECDAASRIFVKIVNQANSPLIAQFGDLTHDPFLGGFTTWDNRTSVTADASFIRKLEEVLVPSMPIPARYDITLENRTSESANANCVRQQKEMPAQFLPVSTEYKTPLLVEKLYQVYLADPNQMKQIIGQYDLVYLARSLKLESKDFDEVQHGRFIRSFTENLTRVPWANYELCTFDHLGNFNRKYVLFGGTIFEVKCFKYTDRSGEYPLLFKPEHPDVWLRDQFAGNATIFLDTDVMEVFSLFSKSNAWLNDPGNLAELDAEIFRNKQVTFMWHSQSSQAKKQFESALRFSATMKKHGIAVEIMNAHNEVILDQNAMIRHAYHYDLAVPDSLKARGFLLSCESSDGFIPENVPHFWSSGSSTLFFGSGQARLMEELLLSFSGKLHNEFPTKKMAILCPARTETRAKKMLKKTGVQVPLIGQNILREEDAFEKLLCTESIELLFMTCANEFSDKDFVQILDVCERGCVMTAVFSPGKDNLCDVDMELISQSYLAVSQDDSITLKDMESGKIQKYRFAQNKHTAVKPSSEEEIQKLINKVKK